MHENEVGTIIGETAIGIHRKFTPGLLESVYEVILAYKLKQRGLNVERQVGVAIEFEEIRFDEGGNSTSCKWIARKLISGSLRLCAILNKIREWLYQNNLCTKNKKITPK